MGEERAAAAFINVWGMGSHRLCGLVYLLRAECLEHQKPRFVVLDRTNKNGLDATDRGEASCVSILDDAAIQVPS